MSVEILHAYDKILMFKASSWTEIIEFVNKHL